ncbi:hypothetical protein ASG48_00985 [Aurantimonas sp. Leaf443]|nr:hypothetical protein ASG48_00985 [Aurantimonas sp. Leaf443]
MSIPSWAEEVDGLIAAIDEESETLTLADGSTYRLPTDFNYGAVGPGMPVVLICEPRAARVALEPAALRVVRQA